MLEKTKSTYNLIGSAIIAGALCVPLKKASAANNFGSIAVNITESISALPGLVAAFAYLVGLLLAVLGVMKIKDHVENPSKTPLKDGAIRLLAGGMLFGLPILLEAMTETLNSGNSGCGASAAQLHSVSFGTI